MRGEGLGLGVHVDFLALRERTAPTCLNNDNVIEHYVYRSCVDRRGAPGQTCNVLTVRPAHRCLVDSLCQEVLREYEAVSQHTAVKIISPGRSH